MSRTVGREEANRLYRRAVDLIEQTGALPVPRNFQLFFEYAEGSDPNLIDAIDQMLQSGLQPSPSELDLLFDLHLLDPTESQEFGELGAKLGKEVSDALEVVREAASSTGDYGDSLSNAETQLGDFSDPERMRLAVKSIVQVTRQMSQRSIEMSSKLSSSAEQIEELQCTMEKIKLESQKDSLTGLANRKFYDETLTNEIATAKQQTLPLSLCMIDVDHFKKFNDSYGHSAGDSALRIVANMFSRNVRDCDLVARYGGEEFSVVMPNADLSIASKVSNRICEALSAKQIVRRSTGERLGNVTVSVGVAQLRENDTAETLIERADGALYEAKRAGRNRVQLEPRQRADHSQTDSRVA